MSPQRDRRSPLIRRALGRTGGRRARDPIANLETHTAADVVPSQLAPWWGVTVWTVLRWIQTGHPRCGKLAAVHVDGSREWVVLVVDARAFERVLFDGPIPNRVKVPTIAPHLLGSSRRSGSPGLRAGFRLSPRAR